MAELEGSISARELIEWEEFYALEPWGSEVEGLRFGSIRAAIMNQNRDPKKHKPLTPQDCALHFGNEPARLPHQKTADEMRATLLMVFPKREKSH